MSNSVSSTSSSAAQMLAQMMQQRQSQMFSKVDKNRDKGIDKTEFSDIANKMSEMTGKSQSVDDIYATYDKDGDSRLSKDELDTFMKANAPQPPSGGMDTIMAQMMSSSMQQGQDGLFSKVDSNGDGGVDKTEFSDLSKKISEHTGNAINVDDVFKTYDANSDGTLSKDELNKFMQENAPAPSSQQTQKAISAYGASDSKDNISTLLDMLQSEADKNNESGATANDYTDFMNKLVEQLKSMVNGKDSSSSSNLSMLDVNV